MLKETGKQKFELKVLTPEERLENFHGFLLNKEQNFLFLICNPFSEGRFYGYLYSKIKINDIVFIYESNGFAITEEISVEDAFLNIGEMGYAGVFLEKNEKFYGSPYSLFNGSTHNLNWLGGCLEEKRKDFQLDCEKALTEELLEKYKKAEDISDTLIDNKPIEEYEVKNQNWKEWFFDETKKPAFAFKFYREDIFSKKDVVNYILNPVETVKGFVEKYNKTYALRELKMFYLAKKAFEEFIPNERNIIRKKILNVLRPLPESVKTVKLYLLGRDSNKDREMENSIENKIIECSYPVDFLLSADENDVSIYRSKDWSIKTKRGKCPLKEIYYEDILKVTLRGKSLYEKE